MNRSLSRVNPLRLAQSAGTLVSVAALLSIGTLAHANPQGGQVVAGSGSISTAGGHTVIHAGDKSVFHWQQFNIGVGESVKFVQPSSTAKVLNRITGPDPSVIAGSLSANGIVYIVNPAGVFFANGATVNVGGLYAAAGSISNADFMSGANKFTGLMGTVENRGTIQGAAVHLLGQRVANYGTIVAPQGMVAMSAGDEVYVGKENGQIFARVTAGAEAGGTGVTQAGTISAAGGQVVLGAGDMYAVAIHHTGSTKAKDIAVQGGERGTVRVSGTLDASNQGQDQTGGTIRVLGDRVAIEQGTLDASGSRGGGTILVGGEFQGQGETQTASRTLVSRGSTLNAEATQSGDGGRIIVWSDQTTVYRGELSVRGGAQGGDGGFAEVSGKENLLFTGGAQTHSRAGGADGTLLLDPRDITIQAGTGPDDNEVLDSQILFGDGGAATDFVIGTDTLEALTGNILLQAQRDIHLNAALILSNQTSGESVTFSAGNDININAPLETNGARVILRANDDAFGTASGVGALNIDAGISTSGGNLNLFGSTINLGANLDTGVMASGTATMVFNGPVVLTQDVTLSGKSGTFNSTLDSEAGEANDLTVNLLTSAFRGDIGAAAAGTQLGTLLVDALSPPIFTVALDMETVRAEVLDFREEVILQRDVTMIGTTSVSFSQALALNSAAGEANDLSIQSPLITFGGWVGTAIGGRLGHVQTATGNTLRIDTDRVLAERLTFRGPVLIDQNTTLSASAAMTFVGTIDSASGEANELTLEGGAMQLTGDIGQTDALSVFRTTSGTLFLDTANLTADTVELGAATRLGSDATINASQSATIGSIGSRGGGTFDLTINSPDTTFNGGPSTGDALGVVMTDAGGVTTLDNATIEAEEIRFEEMVEATGDNTLTGSTIVRFANTLNATGNQRAVVDINSPSTIFVAAIGNTNPLVIETDAAGTTVFGSGSLNLRGATFRDTVVFNTDTVIQGNEAVRFLGAINSQPGEMNDLELNGSIFTLSGGAGTGVNSQFGTITTTQGTTTLGGFINTQGLQSYAGPVLVVSDATINAAGVTFAGTVNSATATEDNALTINTTGNGLTRFEGNVGVLFPLSSLTTNTDGRTELAMASLFASGPVIFGDVVLLDAPTVSLSGGSIRFDQTVNSMGGPRNFIVNTELNGTTTFAGAVGGSGALASLSTNPDGTTRIGGGSITATGAIALNDNVVLENDTLLTGFSVTIGGTGRTLESGGEPRTLTIRPDPTGTTTFGGIVGGTSPLGSITVAPQVTSPTSGTIQFFGNSVRTIGDQLFNQRAILGASAITFTGTNISFVQGIDSTALLEPAALTVNSTTGGITRLFGPIGQSNALRSITTNADGRTILGNSQGAAGDNAAITTTERIAFNDPVTLRNSMTIEGRGGIAFGNALNAAVGDESGPDLVLLTEVTSAGTPASPTAPRITFTNDVGAVTPLGSLTLGDDLQFNPQVATIGAGLNSTGSPIANYSLAINTRRGFIMGRGQRMTVLGDLTIDAGTQAVLSDINTLGSLTVNAPQIVIQQRAAGQVVASGPARLVSDPGVDFNAGEGITFSVAPSLTGEGTPPRFGTPSGGNVSETLSEFSVRTIDAVNDSRLRIGANLLDLVAAGPANVTLATALAGAVPEVFLGAEVPEEAAATTEARQELADIGIPTREADAPREALPGPRLSPDREALLAFLSGPGLFVDVTPGAPTTGPTAVTISRLPADVVSRVLTSYRTIFLRDTADPQTGERTQESNTQHIVDVLSEAWAQYARLAGEQADAVGFRAFVEAVPEQAEALHYLNGLRRLFTDIGYLGLSPAETRRAREAILSALEVRGMTRQQLETAIVTQQLGTP